MLGLVLAHYITPLPRDWLLVDSSTASFGITARERGWGGSPNQPHHHHHPHLGFITKTNSCSRGVARLVCPCPGGAFRGWPRARQTRRARRSSSRANTSSSTECGCRPSAEGRWRRSPTSPSEVATSGSSPTPSRVSAAPRHPSAHFLAVCCPAAAGTRDHTRDCYTYLKHRDG